jgi:hypothetical protein
MGTHVFWAKYGISEANHQAIPLAMTINKLGKRNIFAQRRYISSGNFSPCVFLAIG